VAVDAAGNLYVADTGNKRVRKMTPREVTVAEDAGPQSIPNVALNILADPVATLAAEQKVTFEVSNDNAALFAVAPAISTNGTLTFTSATNAHGSATITVTAKDDGGTANGGVDTSAAQTFTLTVTPVNDPPTFTLATNVVVVLKTSAAISSNAFLVTTSFSPGPADESAQTQVGSYTVTTDNTALFASSKAPKIDATGKLTFTPKSATTTGLATVSVVAQDSGGTANGGVDKRTNTFQIALVDKNTAPSFLLVSDPATAGAAWVPRATSLNWTSIASSSNGLVLVASVFNGNLYVSTNAGATWTLRDSVRNWQGVASSADGAKLVAVDAGGTTGGKIYVSTDFGATWAAKDSARQWQAVASSADGVKLVAVDRGTTAGGQIYVSVNSGGTWTAKESKRVWSGVASSADGAKLAAVVQGGTIYTSVNSGGAWTARTTGLPATATWNAIASSADGNKLVAAAFPGQVYTSADGGANWVARTTGLPATAQWTGVASSADGTRLAATVNDQKLYLSTDSGATWTSPLPTPAWGSIAMSADGTRYAATRASGQIYVAGPTVVVDENSGPFSLPGFAASINPGLPQESYQTVSFAVSDDDTAMASNSQAFDSQPAIAADGTLTFTPKLNATGTKVFLVQAMDDGGTVGGGVDTSAAQLLTILIRPVPKITLVTMNAGRTRTNGNVLSVTVTFNKSVTVTGTPALALVVGDRTVAATYASNSSPNILVFNYTVQPGDVDNDGVVVQSPVSLEGGGIKDAATGVNASLSFTTLTSTAIVDAVSPTVAISAPSLASVTGGAGASVTYTVSFADVGIGVNTGSIPAAFTADKVTLNVTGTAAASVLSVRAATFPAATDYIVTLTNFSGTGTLGISLAAGLVRDNAQNPSAPAGPSATFEVSSTPQPAPVITSVVPPADSTNGVGRLLAFTVNFSASVKVTGKPQLTLDVGGTARTATYVSGSGGTALIFRYTVPAGDNDLDGIAVTSPVSLNGGTLKSAAAVDALRTFTPPAMPNVKVDTTNPTLTISPPSLASTSTGPVTYTLTYADNMGLSDIGFRTGSITLNKTGDANGTVTTSGTGNTRTLTISGITGTGTLSLSVAAGTAGDFARNGANAVGPSTAFNVVNSGAQTITFAQPNGITYGDVAVTNLTATASSGLPVAFEILSGPGTLSDGTNVTITGAGTIRIKATQPGDSMVGAAAPVVQDFVVGKKALTVIAANAVRAYGQPNPAFTANFTGFVGTDTATQIEGAAGLSTTATTTSAPGGYDITPALGSLSATNYAFGTFTAGTLTVTKATATVTLADLAHVYSGSVKSASATTQPAGLTVDFSYTGARINAGSYPVTATINDANYQGTVSDSLVIAKAPQTITFVLQAGSVPLKDLASFALAASSSSGLPVTLTMDVGSAATLSGSVGNYSLTGIGMTGIVTLRANQAGDANYLAGTEVVQTLNVEKNNQAITFAALTDKVFGNAPFTLTATADSTLPVTYTVVSGPATVSGDQLTITGAGEVKVRASQAGNTTFNPAADVDRTFTVGKANQTITFADFTGATYGDAALMLGATADSMLAVTYTVLSGPATVSGGTLTITGAGDVIVQASQPGNANYNAATSVSKTLTVAKKALTATVASAARQVGAADPAFTVNYTGFVGSETAAVLDTPPTVTTTANSASPAGAYPLTAAGGVDNNYSFSYVAGTLTIGLTPQTITFAQPADQTLGGTPLTLNATASSGLPVSYQYVSGPAVLSGNVLSFSGTGPVTVRATQAGNGTFDAATAVERTFNVNPAPNAAPTALALSANTVLENLASGTTVGTLSVTDPNLADTHTYTLVSGAGSTDNAAFTIAGNVLQTAAAFDFETKASYALRVRVTDNGGLFFEQALTVTVVDVNEAPVVTLAQSAVRVNKGSGTFSQATFATFANGPAPEAGQSLLGYTVTVDNAALFSAAPALTANGTLTFTPAANATGTATVTVTARDTGGTANGGVDTSAARTFTVSIVTPPAVFGVTPLAGSFRAGQTVTVTVAFTAPVTLTGTMDLPLTVGSTARVATGATVTDGTNVVFSYVVQAGDTDLDGITLASPLTLAGGTLRDATGVDALLNFTPPVPTGVLVDTTAPAVTISAPSVANTMGGPVTFTVTYADAAFNASTLTAGDLTLNRTGDANGTVTVAGSGNTRTVTISGITGNGTLGISLAAGTASDVAGNLAAAAGPSATFTVFNFLPQTITFGALPGRTYGDTPFALGAMASSSLPVTYTVVSGPATVSGGTLTITGAGTVVVRASQPGDATFSAATSVEQSFVVAKKALTVTAGNAMRAYGVANPAFTATLSGFVNGDTAAVVSGVAGLSSAATTTSAPGNYDITPSVGSLSAANYTFATFTPGTLTVSKATATVTLTELAHTYSGSVKSAVAVTQPAGLTVNLGYTGARINAGSYPVTAVIADANYEGSASGTLVIAKAAQTITFSPPRNQVPLKELVSSPLSATASSSLPATFTLDAGSAATLAGSPGSYSLTGIGQTGTITIRANQPGDANYLPAEEVVRLIDVTKNNQIITFPAVSGKTFGDADVALAATSDSALAVNYLLVSGPAILNNGVLKLTGAGEVRVRASQPGNATFNAAADVEIAFTVGKASQTITFGALAAATYGDANLTLAASASSGLAPTYSVVSGPATVTGGVLTITGAGSVVVQASQPDNENYHAATTVTQTLTVAKKTLTVTVANASRAVGAPDPVFTVGYAGFVRGDTAAVLDVPPTITSGANSTSVAGNYPLTAAGGVDNNYDFSYVAGSLAVNQTSQTITFGTLAGKTYGDAPVVLAATASSGQPVTYRVVSGNATVSGNTLTITGAGEVVVEATQSGNDTFSAASPVTQSFSVAKKALTVVAQDARRAYGQANPSFTASYNGFVGTDTAAVLGGAPGLGTTADSTSAPATYPITPTLGSLSAANYTFTTFTPGTLTVTKAAATVTFADLAHVYSGSAKSATATTQPAGLTVNLSYTGARINAGGYPVTATIADANYEGSVSDTLVIAKAPQTITFAPPPSAVPLKDLGTVALVATASSTLPVTLTLDPGSAATLAGTTGNYSLTGIGTAGTVTIRANQPGDDNYLPATEVLRTLDVTKNNQTITFAALPGKIFGDQPITLGATADSSLVVSYTVVGVNATVSGNVLTITGAGDVVVRASQPGNATFNAAADVERTFTVGKAPQTILFGPLAEVTYGDAPITLAASVNSPLAVTYNVTGPATVSGTTLTITGAGSVVIQAVQAGNENYSAATPVVQTLTVAKRELTATVANAARAVGAPDPAFTVSYTGFAGSETEAVLDTPPTVTSTANSASPAGTYPLTAAGGVDNNYRFTYVAGSLVLSQTPQDITFGTLLNRTYGDAPVVLTATASSGLPVSYTVSGPATLSGNVLTLTGAGTVEVVANQSGNVAFSAANPVTQSFSVAKKPLAVTAANAARAYGVANPAFTAALAGFVNGDTFAVVSGTPAFTTSATTASVPGGYPITVAIGTLNAANYSFDTFVPGTLTVTKATATVTLASLAHTYDGTPKAATATTEPAGLTVNVTYAPGTPLNAGSYTVTATIVDNRYEGGTTGTLVVSKAAQVITFAAPPSSVPLKDLTTVALTATSSSGLSVTLTLDAGSAATLVGSPGNYALTGLGAASPVTLRANQPGNENYLPATEVVRALDVTRNNQAITFAALADKVFGDAAIALAATADSSLPVSFSLVSGPATLVGNVLSFTGAGEVRVRASQPGNASFNAAADVDRTFTVAKAPQVITFASLSARTYGASSVTLSATADSGLPVSFSIVSGPAILSGNVLTITGAGNVVVQASQGGNANYLAATAVQRTLVVGKKLLTVTATDATRRVGAANPTFTFTATGYVGTDTSGVLDTPPTVTTTATATSAAGEYPLTAAGGADDSYEFTYVVGKLGVTQVPQTITFGALAGKAYGDAVVGLNATASSGLPVTFTIVSGPGTLSGTNLTLTGAGTIVVQAAQAGDTTNVAAASVMQELVVAKKALVVGVQDEQRGYGQPNPGFTATFTGFVGTDTAAVLTGSAGFTTTATVTSAPGTYPITPGVGSLSSTNYAFATFNAGTLTVSKAAATVTLADLVHTYSGTVKSATATTVPAGVTVNLVQTGARIDAGSYPVTATITDANYEGSATDTLLISPASQTITYAPLPSSVPLKDLASVIVAATASSGLPVTLTLDGGSAATLSGTVGNYSLTAINMTGTVTLRANQAGNGNYFAAEEVVRTLDVTKNNQAITFGALPGAVFGASPITLAATADSGLTVTYEVVSGPATVTDNVLTITGSGDVVVRAKQAGNGTYNAAADVERTFTVGKANQTITFPAFTGATYGDAALTLGATADSSLAVTYTVVSGPATLNGGELTITGAGDVVVQATQPGNDNFSAASAVTRTLTIAKKGLTATVADAARQVGASDPTFTITYAGFVTGDNELGLDTPPSVTSAANSASAAGDYALTASGGADDNYAFTYVAGKLVISQVPQTIAFGAIATRTFGDPLLVLAATASSGLPVSYSVVSGPATVSGSEVSISAPGVVTLRATQTGNVTYSAATAVEQTFTVNPPPNSPPTSVSLFGASVLENLPAGTVAGTLTATDPNAGDTHTFTLVSGVGDTDNAAFTIVGNELRTAGAFNFEAKATYSIRVRATDVGGLTVEQTFTVTVLDVNEAPVAASNSHTMDQGDTLTVPTATGVLANDSDPDQDALTATLVATTAQGTLRLNPNGSFTYTPASSFFGTDAFTYRATDGALDSATVTVSISVIARPTNAVPSAQFVQKVFSGAILRFSATNLPTANALLVGDPDSSTLTVSLTVTNGTLLVSRVSGLLFANGQTNGTNLILSGLTADVNAALESLAYTSKTNYFGDDTLAIVTTDEGGRTNRGGGTVAILVEIPTLGGVPKVSLEGLNDTMTGRMITNVTGLVMDTNLVQGITYDLTNSVVNVLPVGGQDGSTNRSTITVRVRFDDGTVEDVVVPVIIYQPLLTSVSGDATYAPTFGTPVFNPQTSLYEQKVSVQNNTPFDFTALRITATNLPAGVTLRNATITNGGFAYIEYQLPVLSGSNVTLTLEYYNANRAGGVTPGLKLELLNSTRVVAPPANPVMTDVTGLRGYAPDGRIRFYIEFPTIAGLTYYVQYKDAVGDPWKTSPVVIPGTGNRLNWLDDGAPNTDSPPTASRFYRIVTGQ